jgi:predicted DNA-binding transcriptional regulator AlpA
MPGQEFASPVRAVLLVLFHSDRLLDKCQEVREDVAVPKSPEREGSPRLMSISEIAVEYGVSRTTVHTYRRGGTFPRPAPVDGTEKTKLRFRADEVAAWFEANPKSLGKRTDLAN